jgi:uncharacterized protein (DUF1800 family)
MSENTMLPAVMSNVDMTSIVMNKANVAVNRFGYGASGNELELAALEPREWVKSQLTSISFHNKLPHSDDIFLEQARYQKLKKQQKQSKSVDLKPIKNHARMALKDMSADTLMEAINSSNSVSWRLLDFFSNHFSVTSNGRLMQGLAGTLEREAIAPNLLGNFESMLMAVEQHPAMLVYLNNDKSIGPNSLIAKKRNRGLNENLAREILELHTLGVNSGYTLKDVVELALGISGWCVKNPSKESSAGFIFRSNGHEPGARTLLGKRYLQKGAFLASGLDQGQQMLRDLAMQPATAKHLCYKLAHHFVSENPSPLLLAKMEATWLNNQGNIKQVMHSLFDADEAWMETPQKFKTPREFVISTHRALKPKEADAKTLLNSLISLGQEPFNAGSPAGFSDAEKDWLGGSALMARIDWSTQVSANLKKANAEKVMQITLGESVSDLTYQIVMRAESRQQALTLLLMSPEFQRR